MRLEASNRLLCAGCRLLGVVGDHAFLHSWHLHATLRPHQPLPLSPLIVQRSAGHPVDGCSGSHRFRLFLVNPVLQVQGCRHCSLHAVCAGHGAWVGFSLLSNNPVMKSNLVVM